MTEYDAENKTYDDYLLWDGEEEVLSQENPFFFGMPGEMQPFVAKQSSAFKWAMREDKRLHLMFPNGKTYAYKVSEEMYRRFLASESKGRFFRDHIRGRITGTPVDE